jgi:hypothetical protein
LTARKRAELEAREVLVFSPEECAKRKHNREKHREWCASKRAAREAAASGGRYSPQWQVQLKADLGDLW